MTKPARMTWKELDVHLTMIGGVEGILILIGNVAMAIPGGYKMIGEMQKVTPWLTRIIALRPTVRARIEMIGKAEGEGGVWDLELVNTDDE